MQLEYQIAKKPRRGENVLEGHSILDVVFYSSCTSLWLIFMGFFFMNTENYKYIWSSTFLLEGLPFQVLFMNDFVQTLLTISPHDTQEPSGDVHSGFAC